MYKEYIKRKEKIIITAIELLDELGINGLTTREIANRQGITEPAVYRHYSGKKDIILSILDRFSSFDKTIMNTIVSNNMPYRKGLIYFAKAYSEYYANYPEICTVLFSFDTYRYDLDTQQKMEQIVNRRRDFLVKIGKLGIENGECSKSLEAESIADSVLGIIFSITFLWKINKQDFDLKDRIMVTLENFLLAILQEPIVKEAIMSGAKEFILKPFKEETVVGVDKL